MATTPAERTIYPFSTRDAVDIPVEIIDPTRNMMVQFAVNSTTPFTIPDNYELGFVWSKYNAMLLMGVGVGGEISPLPTINGVYASGDGRLFIPAQTMLTVRFTPGAAKVQDLGNEDVNLIVLQGVVKWNALALQQQSRIK